MKAYIEAIMWSLRMSLVTLACALSSCGHSGSFIVEGSVEGLGTRNMQAVYDTPAGIRSVNVTAVDSRFRFEGDAPDETVVEMYSNTRSLIGRFVARNGDALDVKLRPDNPLYLRSSGNKTGSRLAEFLEDNHYSADSLNEAISRYVVADPSAPLSAILVAYFYDSEADPEGASRLLDMLDRQSLPAFAAGDRAMLGRLDADTIPFPELSLINNKGVPAVLKAADRGRTLVIFDIETVVGDSTVAAVDTVGRLKDVTVNYVRMSPDTVRLHSNSARFPASTNFFRAPGGPARPDLRPLSLNRLPVYIVVDSASRQIFRTSSLDDMVRYLYR